MAKTPADDLVQAWSSLMSRWEMAISKYEAAARSAREAASMRTPELENSLHTSMDELKELKREIDQMIKRGKRGRVQLPGTLVMGTIEQHRFEILTDEPVEKFIRLDSDQK